MGSEPGIDATKLPQIHGHPTICQTAVQIAPVLTKKMMAMMSLISLLAKDENPKMSAPRAALMWSLTADGPADPLHEPSLPVMARSLEGLTSMHVA